MFENFPSSRRRSPQSIVLSLAIHCALLIAILAAGYTVESIVAPRRIAAVQLMAPPPLKHPAVRLPKPAIRAIAKLSPPLVTVPAPPVLRAPPAAIETPAMPQIVAPAPIVAAEQVAATAPLPVRIPSQSAKVQTGGFASASTAPGGNLRTTQVASVGFGDAGIVPSGPARRAVSTAGFGDAGVASSGVARRSVSTTGFGDGAIASASAGARGQVRSGGFGDTVSAAPSATAARPQLPTAAIAAQILQKPRPAYTEEARKLEIEGEVQLEVVFGASGEVHIVRVVHGLGHGLDENAVLAAKAIRFLPAKRDGHTVDSTAMIHIVFQLAS